MKRPTIKNPSLIFVIWIIISGLISGFATLKLIENNIAKNPKIFLVCFMILIYPMLWLIFPSLCKKEHNTGIKKVNEYIMKGKNRKRWKSIVSFILIIIAVAYFSNRRGFELGRSYVEQIDSTNPRKWTSKKWGYEIIFPSHWENIKRHDSSIKSMGADVFCGSRTWASTAVFVYPKTVNTSLDNITDGLLNEYKKITKKEVKIIEKKDYEKDNLLFRTLIFQCSNYLHHYTFVISKKLELAISSNCSPDIYETLKSDFESIVDSLKILEEK